MKNFLRAGFFLLAGVMMLGVFGGCSQDSYVSVKAYNNSIVDLQKGMFTKAQEASKVFDQQNPDSQVILQTLQDIQTNIIQSHDRFKAMSVPAGGEDLSVAMESFFQVEIQGVHKIIVAVQQLQSSGKDSDAAKVFADTFKEFSSQENSALRDFYSTQQKVATKYGQKVVQTEN